MGWIAVWVVLPQAGISETVGGGDERGILKIRFQCSVHYLQQNSMLKKEGVGGGGTRACMNASECGAQGLGSDSSTTQQHSVPSVIIHVHGET